MWDKINNGDRVFLTMAATNVIAKITLNGIMPGGTWTAPYKINITKALKKAVNKLEIRVVNTWVNRLIGDSRLPVNERKTWTMHKPYHTNSKLQSSGLLGPVKPELIKK